MIFICAVAKKTTVHLDLTRHPTLLVKADNGAVILAPRAHVHSSSFSDVGLAGVGFRGTDQNVDARAAEKKILPIICTEAKFPNYIYIHFLVISRQ